MSSSSAPIDTRVVLPTNVIPSHYDLQLAPDLDAWTFGGTCTAHVDVHEASTQIVVNAADLNFSSAKVAVDGDAKEFSFSSADIKLDAKEQTATLSLPEELASGSKAKVHFAYTGTINDSMKGFYRTSSLNAAGETMAAATCQFEACDARRALPCWDEPNRKASFSVSLVVDDSLPTVLGNMPEESREPVSEDADGKKKTLVKFQKTPVMSTYLLCWAMGTFDYVESTTKNGVKVRVYGPQGKVQESGKFAVDVGVRSLEFYEDYFGIPYPLPKLDMIALSDFSMGAMENWGLVTYRETMLLSTEQSSALTKETVLLTVTHELAHQWFGNLVTMDWWRELWLNEGFASWGEYVCSNEIYPDWKLWETFSTREMQGAFSLDSLVSSHPIEVDVSRAEDVDEVFDAVSYNKGCAVIRMIHSYLGDATFRKGVSAYLKHFAYANAKTTDLWTFLGEAAGEDVAGLMSLWTQKTGYPVLEVSLSDDQTQITVEQHRFLASGLPTADQDDTVWKVPMVVRLAGGATQSLLLTERSQTFTLDKSGWVKVNADVSGLYRVVYAPSALEKLLGALAEAPEVSGLSALDRSGLLEDFRALAEAGRIPTSQLLDLIVSLKGDEELAVVTSMASAMGAVVPLVRDSGDAEDVARLQSLRGAFAAVLSPVLDTIGWEAKVDDPKRTKDLRAKLVAALCGLKDAAAIAEARSRFTAHIAGTKITSTNILGTVFITAVANGGKEEFDAVRAAFHKAREAGDAEVEKICIRALANTRDEALVLEALRMVQATEIRNQDVIYVTREVFRNATGRKVAWKWVQDEWDYVFETFSKNWMLGGILDCLGNFSHESDAVEIEAFFKDHDAPTAKRSIVQAVESVRSTASWRKRDLPAVRAWVDSKQ